MTTMIFLGSICNTALAGQVGFYMGIGGGYSKSQQFDDASKDNKNKNIGGKLIAGYQINDYLGLELLSFASVIT